MTESDSAQRWNERYRHSSGSVGEPASFLTSHASLLPKTGTALDIGSGEGRNSLYLASLGLDVTLLDVSQVALDTAERAFDAAGFRARYVCHDVEADGVPNDWFDVVLMHLFFDRDVLAGAAEVVAPGGLLLLCQPTVTNLQRNPRPSERFLLADGEVATLAQGLQPEFEILEATEAWRASGRHDAWLVARRPARTAR